MYIYVCAVTDSVGVVCYGEDMRWEGGFVHCRSIFLECFNSIDWKLSEGIDGYKYTGHEGVDGIDSEANA